MANRYWVYNGGNINDTTHWSATSGGAGGASKPTLSDNVIFDANSFTLNAQVVTLNEAFNCLSMDWTGITKSVTLSSSVYSLNLYGNLTLATGLTWAFTGTAYLNHKSSGTVTTNGIILNANRVYFDAAGITVTNGDAANYGVASFYLTNGTWNTNGKTTNSTGSFNTVAGTKTLTLGASVFNIGTWTNTVPTGFTFNYNTSTVVITTASILTGITSFYNLTCSGVVTLTLANNITVTNALTLAGSSVSNRLKILSSVAGTQRTVTVPAAGVFPSNLDVQDMAFPNAVDMSGIAGYSQDFGNNTGITFTASANLFFKHTSGAANWGDITKWVLADRSTQGRIPLIQDDVNFDNLSFTGTSTLNLNVLATCRSMNWTGLNQAVTLSSSVNSLSIYGHTTLATGLTWTFTGTAYTNISGLGSFNITMNGVVPAMNKLYFDRVGGTWTNQDDFNVGAINTYLRGTWNTNGKTITVGRMDAIVNYTAVYNFGSSIVNLNRFNNSLIGLTINAGTSTINCAEAMLFSYDAVLWDVNLIGTYNHIFYNLPSFRNLTKLGGGSIVFNTLGNINVTGTLTIKGNNSTTDRNLLAFSAIANQLSITAANVVFENVDFRDIKGLGTANWNLFSIPGGSGDCGGNSNITFTPSQTQYYKHTSGACNWHDSKWYTTSGGSIAGRVPLPQDDAIFDGNSFTGASVLSFSYAPRMRTLDMSLVSYPLVCQSNVSIQVYGNFTLSSNVTSTFLLSVISRTVCNITMAGNSLNSLNGTLGLMYGVVSLNDDLKWNTGWYTNPFTLNANNYNVIVPFIIYSTGGQAINMGTGTLILNGAYSGSTPALFSPGSYDFSSATIRVQSTGGGTRAFDITYMTGIINKVIFEGNHVGDYIMAGSKAINELVINAGKSLKFTAGTTTTIGKLTAIGTQSQPITIGSVTAAPHNLIKTGADMVEVEYCNISNSIATPSDKWAAGDTSTDGGGNSGWTFKYIPIIMWFFGIFSKPTLPKGLNNM